MKKLLFLIISIFLCLALASCRDNKTQRNHLYNDATPITFKYAKLVKATKHDDHIHIDILNPWDSSSTLRSIYIKIPVTNAAVYSSTHVALLKELGVEENIGGIFDVEYLKDSQLKQKVLSGEIMNLGNSNVVNIERLIELQPDLLMPSPYENQGGYGRLEKLGIPILECADYMEVSPLSRAEWIRLYGIIFGVEDKADSIFHEIEQKYINLKELASASTKKVRLLTERPYSGTWHVPCGESSTGILYRDAGADYVFSHLPGNGSKPMNIEMVMESAIDADLWLIKSYGELTREQITKDYPSTKHIKAQLFVCNTKETPYFEETPFHPELLLENLISLFHPELNINPQKKYFQ